MPMLATSYESLLTTGPRLRSQEGSNALDTSKFATVLGAAAPIFSEVEAITGHYKGNRFGGDAVDRLQLASYPKLIKSATQCLMTKPAITPRPEVAPGAKSKYDDFVAVYINYSSLPYWNWGKYTDGPLNSALFDGSDHSLGGVGSKIDYIGVPITGAPEPYDLIPPGNGGDCMVEGPFVNYTVNLGSVAGVIPSVTANPHPDGLGYNPRCISHVSAAVTATNCTYRRVRPQQVGRSHRWHFTVGGDPGGDFFTSPGDPAFCLHHGMIDRVWWIWQMQEMEESAKAVAGTLTLFSNPPSRNGTLEDDVDIGSVAGAKNLGGLLDTMDGPFCYIYV
ncbi:hypothetical protein MKZ38_000091 [Zalerion maritima]|uniref:Tyrosinase copper-binding domain-containing protein n=1 Tax=Zalerion maritima TaxID=339359 RepID=A0AAD5S043_9PEZI|nr:hypothetical protein MKZ38_000091 [Zalerion maritima]